MSDREEVIQGLEHCASGECEGCPYQYTCKVSDRFSELARDALAQLRPKRKTPCVLKWRNDRLYCNDCNELVGWLLFGKLESFNYCPGCGRKVKWDDQ